MNTKITGKAFVLGTNIDTDQIIPAEHLVYSLTDEEESKKYGQYALSAVPHSQSGLPFGDIPFVKEGEYKSEFNIIIGSGNFGCGSSREHAPFALNKAGVEVIVATSYAKIFYRNSVDGGFLIPYESVDDLSKEIKTGDEIEINVENNTLKNLSSNKEYSLKSLGSVLPIVEHGGIFEYARKTGMI